MDLNEFKAVALQGGILRPNRFKVRFYPPTGLNLGSPAGLEFWGETSEIPLLQLGTHQMQRHGYGSPHKRPNMATYQEWQVVFRVDSEGQVWQYFHNWMEQIVNNDINRAGPGLYEIAYRDTYLADLECTVYDTFDNKAIDVTMIEAFPMALSPIKLDWADNNSYMRASVVFSFTDWINTTAINPA